MRTPVDQPAAASPLLSGDDQTWLDEFRRAHGRAPSILHIGNIANNAYINAKLLNEAGFDCDVLCYDYYHLMGCPEWEDAEFNGDVGDQNRPNWTRVRLHGFRRPKWFVQGPILKCLEYLALKRSNRHEEADEVWRELQVFNRTRKPNVIRDMRSYSRLKYDRLRQIAADYSREHFAAPVHRLLAMLAKCRRRRPSHSRLDAVSYDASQRVAELTAAFARVFPDRRPITPAEFSTWTDVVPVFKPVLDHYDVVQAYATDPIWPLLADKRPYVAFEHGTIRDIPFEENTQGRIAALAYHFADVAYLTNADSQPQARRLRGARPSVYGLHGFDDRKIDRLLARRKLTDEQRTRLGYGDEVTVFFAPARHHWRHGFATWLKGNDKIVRALRSLVDEGITTARVVFVEWGKEIAETKQLIAELNVGAYVRWVKPLDKASLIYAFADVDAVLDQFVLPCIGAVTYEAMAVGRAPVITRLDTAAMAEFYGEIPPLYIAADYREIAEAMREVVHSPEAARSRAQACREWLKRRHSHRTVVAKQIQAYRIAGLS